MTPLSVASLDTASAAILNSRELILDVDEFEAAG